MKNFNAQYGKHSRLELLKHFILEHGTYIELKKGEQFSVQGKMNRRGAYIENGLLRYIHVDERGNIHIVGYTFSNEFAGSLCTFINPDRPSGSYTLDKKRSVILPATSIPYKVGAGFSYEIGKHAIIKSQTNYQYNIIQKKWEWFFGAGVFFTF